MDGGARSNPPKRGTKPSKPGFTPASMVPMELMRQQAEARKLGITAKSGTSPVVLSVAMEYVKEKKAAEEAAAEEAAKAAEVAETARRAAAEQAEVIAMAAIVPAGAISGDENPLAAARQTPAYAAVNALTPLTQAQELVLALADNIHDAWGGFRNKPGGAEINDVLLAIGSRKTQTAYPPINFTAMLTAYGFPHIQTSKIEATTIAHFEKNYSQIEPVSPNAVATYEQIIAAPDIPTLEARVKGLRTTYDSYVITSPNSNIETLLLDPNNQAKICAFVRTFLFGQNAGYTMYPTFDAHSGVFAKIFRDQPDMRVLITPMNIADSATTSYKKIGLEEPVFFFPETEQGRFKTTRNTLTRDPLAAAPPNPAIPAITMSYINNGFGPLLPTNFSFEIAMAGVDPITGSYRGFPQGPSLDYLIDLTLAAAPPPAAAVAGPVDFSRVQPSSSCFLVGTDIHNGTAAIRDRIVGGIRAFWDAIFMDIKRMGDQDQVDAAFVANASLGRVVLVTIDRLCALAARLKGIPCIWHDGEKIILYKNHRMDTTLTPEEIAAYEAAKEAKFVGENTAMYNYITSQEALGRVAAFAGSIPLDPAVPSLLQRKFVDMHTYLASAHAALDAYIAQLNIALTGDTATDATKINNLFEALGSRNIEPRAAVDIYTFISGGGALFNKQTDYPFLNYSYKKFKEVKSSFDTIRNTVLSVRPRREPIDFGAALNGPDGYNTLVTRIIDSLLIDGVEEALKGAYLLLPADLNAFQNRVNSIDKYLEAEKNNPAAKGGLKADAMAASDAIKASLIARFPVAVGTDDPRVMIGGALADDIALFKDICEQAANVVNVAVAAVAPVIRQQYALKRFLYEYRLFLRNQKRDNTLLFMALQTVIHEGVTINGNLLPAILPAEIPNAYLARLNAQPWFNLAAIQAQINAYVAPGVGPGPDQVFYDALPAATFQNLLESLKNQWGERYRAIDILLEPYADDATLKNGHPLKPLLGPPPNAITIARATTYSLFVLTELNDIFQGKVRNNTSILPSLFGGFPASLKYYTLTIPKEWSNLPRIIDALTRMTAAGRFSNEPLRLFAGGTRKRSSKKGRKTMRNRKRRTIRNHTQGSSNKRKTIRHH
jgi:hypothetical protein